MAKVFSPNKDYTGISATVDFTQGVGECADPHLIEWFRKKGYTIEDEQPGGESINIDGMTVKELKAYAAEKGIELGEAKTKADLIAAIEAAEPNNEGEGGNE